MSAPDSEMPSPDSETDSLNIRCPSCGQRFKAAEDLEGRMVECGSCDHRFRIDDSVILRTKRYYPGERRDPSLDRFGRIPGPTTPATGFAPAPVAPAPAPHGATPDITTASPARALAGALAVLLFLAVGLLLWIGGQEGGMLSGTPRTKQLLLAGFAGVIAAVLLQCAVRRRRLLTGLVGLVLLLGLMSIPWFRDLEAGVIEGGRLIDVVESDASEPQEDPLAELKSRIGYQPLADARAERAGEEGQVFGIWMTDLREFNSHEILKYLKRRTGADHQSWFYPRGDGNYLLVLTGVEVELAELAELCLRFGQVEGIVEELGILEVVVDNTIFEQESLEVLQDSTHPDFYKLNRGELENIDLKRAQRAVMRLARVEPKVYRKDIVARFHDLMDQGDTEMRRDLAGALAVWAEEGDGSEEIVLEIANDLFALEGRVPQSVVEFLVRGGNEEIVPLLARLWRQDPETWQALMREAGPAAEPFALESLRDGISSQRFAAVRVLRQVGTERSLEDLEAARADANREFRVLVDDAIQAILKRES